MPNCSIVNCPNSTKKRGPTDPTISYHAFPKNPEVKRKWIDATGQKNWFPSKHSRICCKHFTPESFSSAAEIHKRLLKTAYPVIDIVVSSNDLKGKEEQSVSTIELLNMPNKKKMMHKLKVWKNKCNEKDKIIKMLRERNRRKEKKIALLVEAVKTLKKQLEIKQEKDEESEAKALFRHFMQ